MNNHLRKVYLFLIVNIFFLWECTGKSPGDEDKAPDKVEIPFVLENGRIVIEADINGTTGRFIFDTGTTESYGDINPRGLGIQAYGITLYKGRK